MFTLSHTSVHVCAPGRLFFSWHFLTLHLSYADQAIDGGKVVIEVSYFGLHVHTEKIELSDETSCPIAAGNFVLSHTQTLPGYTPPVSLTLLDLDFFPYVLTFKLNIKKFLMYSNLNMVLLFADYHRNNEL
jgi:hypothetical protein